MYSELEIKERIVIIRSSDLDDAKILCNNYAQLIGETSDNEEKHQYIILRSNAQSRIKKLNNTHDA